MREPPAEPFGRGGTFHGLQTMPADRFTMAVSELNRRGWRVATHAVGDVAIDQVLAGYEAAIAGGSIGHRRGTSAHPGGWLRPWAAAALPDRRPARPEARRGGLFRRFAD